MAKQENQKKSPRQSKKVLSRSFHIMGYGMVRAGDPVTAEIRKAWNDQSKHSRHGGITPNPIDDYLE